MIDVEKRTRLVFSGAGGQGVITAAILLAEAAVMHENLIAVQSQVYGPEARGGASRSDVIISDREIHFPKVKQPNTLVCLNQESYNKYYHIIRPGGILITDPRFVVAKGKVDARLKPMPMYQTVMDKIGKPIVLNICMLGALLGLTDIVKAESVMGIIEARLPKSFHEMNRRALLYGRDLGVSHRND